MPYFESIDGMKLDKAIGEACREAGEGQGDGRVSVEDAEAIFDTVKGAAPTAS